MGGIATVVRQVLGVDESMHISPKKALKDMGMDSLMSVELRNQLSTVVGESLPATLVFDFPDLHRLATFLLSKVSHVTSPPGSASTQKSIALESIAIVGMACRFPGGAHDVSSFWSKVLEPGVDCIVEVPSDRWDVDEFYSSERSASGKMVTRYGGFLQSPVAEFEPSFFRYCTEGGNEYGSAAKATSGGDLGRP
jgi:acyl carrier protein